MNPIAEFSSSLGRRDQQPNKDLAQRLVQTADVATIQEIITYLKKPESEDLLFDALKVLEMIGELNAELAKPAFDGIIKHLKHPTNKVQWMAMSALSQLTQFFPHKTFDKLELLVSIMDKGSVITKDKGFKILIDLYQVPQYRDMLAPLMEEQLLLAPDNQLGQYAEKWMKVAQKQHLSHIKRALETRSRELSEPSHQKRLAKNLLQLTKLTTKKSKPA